MFPDNVSEKRYSYVFIIFIYAVLSITFNSFGWNLFDDLIVSGEGHVSGYPTRLFAAKFSFWNPYIQCGTFNLKDIGFQSLYPVSLLITKILPNFFGYNIILLLHYTFAGFFTYIFCKKLKLNSTASFIGGLCFMFCGFLISHRGHQAMMEAAVWLPLILYFVESFFNNKKLFFLLCSGIAFAMSILADYLAVPMYIGMVVFPYMAFKVFLNDSQKKISRNISKIFFYSFAVFGTGLLLSSVTLLPIAESLKYVTRESIDYNFFTDFSFKWKYLPIIIFPFFYGYHSAQWNLVEMAGYMGIIPLVSSVLCFSHFRKKDIHIYFWGVVAAIAFILVLGKSTPLYRIMFYVPVYNMFRAPARNWFEVHFAVAILMAYFVHYIMGQEVFEKALVRKIRKAVMHITVITLFIIFIAFIIKQFVLKNTDSTSVSLFISKISLSESALKQLNTFAANYNFIPPSQIIFIPLLIIFISMLFLLNLAKYYKSKLFWIVLSIFIFFDLFSFGYFHDFRYGYSSNLKNIEKNELYRFFNMAENNFNSFRIHPLKIGDQFILYPETNMVYGLSTINAYGAIWMKDYSEFTGFTCTGITDEHKNLLKDPRIISSLSVKYILTYDADMKKLLSSVISKNSISAPDKEKSSDMAYYIRYETNNGVAIFENRSFLPRARFVTSLEEVSGISDVKNRFKNDSFEPATTALVENFDSIKNLSQGVVIDADYKDDSVELEVKTYGRAFLILSDSYYPGWKAYVDDTETMIYKVNGVMRGVLVQNSGEHKVRFIFRPFSFYAGLSVTVATFLVMILLCAVSYKNRLFRTGF